MWFVEEEERMGWGVIGIGGSWLALVCVCVCVCESLKTKLGTRRIFGQSFFGCRVVYMCRVARVCMCGSCVCV